ncbi:DUF6460 domain-containing protein [Hoeflea prorocentri]|uniref:DUF6460 domain-containing protein n=1 Tax=Hoeflea prorocentri TaxID=1922333 RepID=A0A9X3UNW9_9HYPH|nr:DUF6460 domain-containing protein [Hoeflea prorocentri]MCY6382506.1 DUF6460 domain-containing protein [Hoeflea prorocentri]MDA5400306.1 DUF6460 domain-containing protein [Hoeflea prorocentri]
MSGNLNRFLGDTPGRTLIKLIVLSFIVGAVMAAFNWYPMDVVRAIVDFIRNLWELGFAALGRFGDYLVLGAVVVVPVFLIIRIMSYRR